MSTTTIVRATTLVSNTGWSENTGASDVMTVTQDNDDSTYALSTVLNKQLMVGGFPRPCAGSIAIAAIRGFIRSRKQQSASGTSRIGGRWNCTGGTEQIGTALGQVNNTFITNNVISAGTPLTNPRTGNTNDWTLADFDSLSFGGKLTNLHAGDELDIAEFWLEVDWDPVAVSGTPTIATLRMLSVAETGALGGLAGTPSRASLRLLPIAEGGSLGGVSGIPARASLRLLGIAGTGGGGAVAGTPALAALRLLAETPGGGGVLAGSPSVALLRILASVAGGGVQQLHGPRGQRGPNAIRTLGVTGL